MEKTKPHGFSQHSAEIQCFKVLSGKDLLSRFLKEYCLPSVFTKCHLSQEMGVELELKIQAAIKSDPAI